MQKTVDEIKDILNDYTDDKWDKLEDLLYRLFFTESNYIDASSLLRKNSIENRCGERDSFGPLSWGVLTPSGWKWFG